MTTRSAESWSTLQLAEFVALVSGSTDEQDALQRAVERAADALEAEVCALVGDHRVLATIGFPSGEVPEARLVGAVEGKLDRVVVQGLGELWTLAMPLDGDPPSALLVARLGGDAFSQEESDLLRGMARSLELTLRLVGTLDHERELRRKSQREVRQRKKAERELAHQALHDGLTGLPNRSLLRDRAIQALDRARDSALLVAALLVDLDHFKVANDLLGHGLGDQLLLLLAQRLTRAVAAQDDSPRSYTVARTGGDEFFVLCEELVSEHEAVGVAQRIKRALEMPFVFEGQEVKLTASIGIAITRPVDGDDQDSVSADDLLRDAELAVARAKSQGRDCYEVFDEQMRVRLFDRIQLEADLRAALAGQQLRLLYQPVVAVEDGTLVAVEALVRWEHPSRGTLSPAEFIPVAEQSDLIIGLGEWVIEEACRQLVRWRQSHRAGSSMRVSVNVSARQLTPALIGFVSRTLTANAIHPSQLALEITETLLIEQAATSREILDALKQLGVGIVLDDFGTGYSSLSYLKSFALDQLKVDRSFIAELSDDTRSAKIVSATVEMARALGMTVVAEGVETAAQLEVLQRLGCDYAQGYHFAAPAPAAAIARRIEEAAGRDRSWPREARKPASPVVEPDAAMQAPEESEARRRAAIGRVAGLLFCAAGVVNIPSSLVLRDPPSALVIAGLSLVGLSSGVICLLLPWRRLAWRWLHATAVLATGEVALSVWALGHPAVFTWYYVLIAAAVGYAFSDYRQLAAHVLVVALAIAAPLLYAADPSGDGVPRTVLAIAIVAATAALVMWLREQLEANQSELRELAARDPLTGVGNYRLLHERLEYELRRHQRGQKQLAVLLIDLDRFKQVNERLGHAAGDDVLRRVSRAMCGAIRQQDTVARQGGDEFAVLAPETDAEGALTLAARIRERVSEVRIDGETMGATVGFSIYPVDGGSTNVLLARADARMLADKSRPRPQLPASAGSADQTEAAPETSDLVGADVP